MGKVFDAQGRVRSAEDCELAVGDNASLLKALAGRAIFVRLATSRGYVDPRQMVTGRKTRRQSAARDDGKGQQDVAVHGIVVWWSVTSWSCVFVQNR